MNCDLVFKVLTSGPFPSGAVTDLAVEEHLEHCTSCWRIAEALRPADDLFQEAVPAVEGRDLPGYWGDATPPGVAIEHHIRAATRAPLTLPARARSARRTSLYRSPPSSTWRDIAQVAGFLVLVTTGACGLSWLFG